MDRSGIFSLHAPENVDPIAPLEFPYTTTEMVRLILVPHFDF